MKNYIPLLLLHLLVFGQKLTNANKTCRQVMEANIMLDGPDPDQYVLEDKPQNDEGLGVDGFPNKPGANFFALAFEVDHPEKLTIHMQDGKSGDGQAGSDEAEDDVNRYFAEKKYKGGIWGEDQDFAYYRLVKAADERANEAVSFFLGTLKGAASMLETVSALFGPPGAMAAKIGATSAVGTLASVFGPVARMVGKKTSQVTEGVLSNKQSRYQPENYADIPNKPKNFEKHLARFAQFQRYAESHGLGSFTFRNAKDVIDDTSEKGDSHMEVLRKTLLSVADDPHLSVSSNALEEHKKRDANSKKRAKLGTMSGAARAIAIRSTV